MTHISLRDAAENFKEFLLHHLPDGTAVNITASYAEEIGRAMDNQVAWATNAGVDADKPRQRYEAVGWLSVQLDAWLYDSDYDDHLLEVWSLSMLG